MNDAENGGPGAAGEGRAVKGISCNLRKGQILDSGFEILDLVELAEMEALGVWARRCGGGAEVFHVLNNDNENLFSFAFATAPEDDTGAAHILEHSVLCGSEHYPLKDAFLTLAQGSLQTFLNAWTFPDKTVYPASSVNEHDYFNLMAVYGDAVFRPLLSEWTFMQEGHRLEFAAEKARKEEQPGGLRITGVVYNEMKGAYSSLDAWAGLWSVKAVMPGSPYAFESGGDPGHIPDLGREDLAEFHRRRYSPANCRIFLAGNIPTEKQLAFLDGKFFSSLEPGAAAPPIEKIKRWDAPKNFTVPCPAGGEKKSTAFLSWLCSDVLDSNETHALAALTEILLGHDGSPLTRALIESGLGEDIAPVSGLEGEIRETLFVAGLRGLKKGVSPRQVEDLILGELRRLADKGIPAEEIEAALLSMEFSHREIRRSGGPFSLVWMRRSLRGWLHGAKPWESLLFMPCMTELKNRLAADKHYFESLIKKYLLDNPHRALVALNPEKDFLEKQEAERAEALAEKERGLPEPERRAIIEKSAALERFQTEGDSPEALAAIPHLSRKDLSAEIEKIPRRIGDAGGIPVLNHELYTNGISYVDLAFPLDVLSPGDYLWLPFFSRAVVSVGLPGMDYGEVSSLLARTAGGFTAMLQNGSAASGAEEFIKASAGLPDIAGRDWIIYRLKALDEKAGASLDLALRLITEADFSDERRVRDLVLEMKNEIDSSLAPLGHSYALTRSNRFFTRARSVEELWGGLTQIEFAHRLAETGTAEIIGKLKTLRELIVRGGLVANLTGNARALEAGLGMLAERFGGFGPPRPGNPDTAGAGAFRGLSAGLPAGAPQAGPALPKELPGAPLSAARGEVWASPSLQVGFAAMTLKAAPFDSPEQTAEIVLAHQLSTGALWEDIRMKGGAYGAFANPDSLEGCFSFSTYRDPDPLRSIGAFSSVLQSLAGEGSESGPGAEDAREDELVKAIIGCYARETRPRTGAEKGITDFLRFLYGIEDAYRERKLKQLVTISQEEISAALKALAARTPSCPVIVSGVKNAEQAAKVLGLEVKELPV
ncbi:MAG: insulinase family protein [Treponema sp.]|jgi:Zn-dependent M16 (insulinase) family peptidase|nr:insulinase family protein [Treponema sp.]